MFKFTFENISLLDITKEELIPCEGACIEKALNWGEDILVGLLFGV